MIRDIRRDRRAELVAIRLTEEERARLEELAERRRTTLSGIVRELLDLASPPNLPPLLSAGRLGHGHAG